MSRYWFFLLCCCGAIGRAEEIWFAAEGEVASPGSSPPLRLARGAEFAEPDSAVAPENIARVASRLGGQEMTLGALVAKDAALEFRFAMPRAGFGIVAVELKTQPRELSEDAIERRLRALHANDALRAQWLALPAPRRWRETMTQTTKTFVRCGEPAADDRSWAAPVGLPLEIVPERDPTRLRVDERFEVRILRAGKPQPNLVITFLSDGGDREHVVLTDDEGRAGAVLDVASRWLIRGVDLKLAGGTDLEWESVSTTLAVTVK